MKDIIQFTRQLLKENPNITPLEMMHNLHISDIGAERAIFAVHEVLGCGLEELCTCAVQEYRQPLVTQDTLTKALLSCGFAQEEIEKTIAAVYPNHTRYAVSFSSASQNRMYAPAHTAYNVGTGDFTVEGWVKPLTGGGTIISRKSMEGCYYNGGFLLVLKPDGVIKLATDDGFGFYEVNSVAVNAYDGNYHHVLGLRRGDILEIYFDFVKIEATPRTDRFPKLNIDNNRKIVIGATDQIQEPYNYFNGNIGECRIWNTAKTYKNLEEWINTEDVSPNLIGMWGFWNQTGADYSFSANAMDTNGFQFESWQL